MCFDSFHSMYVPEVFVLKSECMMNCDFCLSNQTGCVCLALLRADWLHAIPKTLILMEQQPWPSRSCRSHLALPGLPGDNPRAPLGPVPSALRAVTQPRWDRGGSRPWGPGAAGREQGGSRASPRSCCSPTINQFMADLRMAGLGKKSLEMELLNSQNLEHS